MFLQGLDVLICYQKLVCYYVIKWHISPQNVSLGKYIDDWIKLMDFHKLCQPILALSSKTRLEKPNRPSKSMKFWTNQQTTLCGPLLFSGKKRKPNLLQSKMAWPINIKQLNFTLGLYMQIFYFHFLISHEANQNSNRPTVTVFSYSLWHPKNYKIKPQNYYRNE